jgi:hypothetical protein
MVWWMAALLHSNESEVGLPKMATGGNGGSPAMRTFTLLKHLTANRPPFLEVCDALFRGKVANQRANQSSPHLSYALLLN